MYQHMAAAIGLRYFPFGEGIQPNGFNSPVQIDANALAATVERAIATGSAE
jgi:hypothetical protein